MLAYVRYFHPSDAAAGVDWDSVAVAGVSVVEPAADARALADALRRVFGPLTVGMALSTDEPNRATSSVNFCRESTQVVAWRHVGVGDRRNPPQYGSTRIAVPAPNCVPPDSVPDPRQPFVSALGGGVWLVMPTALFVDPSGRPGAGPRPNVRSDTLLSAARRDVRLAAVAMGWGTLKHFYPYWDVAGTDWDAQLAPALRAAATDADELAFLATLRRLIAAMNDGHANVYHRRDPASHLPPVELEWVEGRLAVAAVVADSAGGLRPGDVLVSVDGRPVGDVVAELHPRISAANEGWRRYRSAGDVLAGPRDSPARLVVERGGRRQEATLVRSRFRNLRLRREGEPLRELEPGIFYVDLDRITQAQYDAAVGRLAEARGIVFDLRGYPREVRPAFLEHLSREPLQSARWIIPIATQPADVGRRFHLGGRWNLTPRQPHVAAPRVFLIDGRAISYAESVMGIVEAYRLGETVGDTTAATNGNVQSLALPGGYTVAFTGMKVLKHDESQHHMVGIAPTVPAARTLAGLAAGRDEVLERGLQVLREKIAVGAP
ncbi:MAG TPA: S41 family peptidase [Longimicrobium sp.]|nr:S41 family peptidase [Longimicrobium sp.]